MKKIIMTIAMHVTSLGQFAFSISNLAHGNYALALCGTAFSFLFFHLARKGWPFSADRHESVLTLRLISGTGAIMGIVSVLDAKFFDAFMSCLMAWVWLIAARTSSKV